MPNFPTSLPSATPATHGEVVGEVVAMASALIGMPGRNVVRNGDMSIAQRGNGSFTTTGVYTADGWTKDHVGGTHTVNRTTTAPGSLPGGSAASAVLDVITSGQAAAGDFSSITQRVESVRTLAGQQATLSFIAYAATGTPKIGVEVIQFFGSGGSPSSLVLTAMGAVTLSTTSTRYTVALTVPSIAGKTLGTNGDDRLQINLWTSAGSTFAARAGSIGIQNSTISITDVQLEAGPVATPFERLPQQTQLAWCQRYFKAITAPAGAFAFGSGFAYATTGGRAGRSRRASATPA